MKKFGKLAVLIVLVALSIILCSCGKVVDYTIYFDVDGTTYATISTTGGETIKIPDNPTKEGYTFVGWYWSNGTAFTVNSLLDAPISSDMTVYGKWITEAEYTITFDSNGGSAVSAITAHGGESVSAPSAPTKTGFSFVGWYTDNTLANVFTFSIMPESNITVYAKWNANTTSDITITFSVDGATYSSIKTTGNETIQIPNNPAKEGYTFSGWYWANGNAFTVNSLLTTPISSSMTVYAKWTIKTYYVIFSGNEGTLISGEEEQTIEHSNSAIAPIYEKDGFMLSWDKTFDNITANTTVTAVWTIKSYNLALTSNMTTAGTISGAGDKEYNSNVTITANTNPGYTWLGWYDGDTKVSTGTSLYYSFTMPAINKAYEARWMACPVTLSKNISAAGSANGVEITAIGEATTITATTNSGYTWLGWYDGDTKISAATNQAYTFIMPTEGTTFMAKWMACPVTLSKNISAAGSVNGIEKTALDALATITATTNPGYTWLGWYDGNVKVSEGVNHNYTFTMSVEIKTFEAKWEINEELSDFYFTTTANSITITGVKDKTKQSFIIPSCVTGINSSAFSNCINLTTLLIPNSVLNIGDGAFAGCTNLTSITVGINNPNYSSEDGILYNKSKTDIILVPAGKTGIVILPNSITSIKSSTFSNCNKILSIVISDSITSIGYGAFDYCSSLTAITVDTNNIFYSSQDGILYNKIKSSIIHVPISKTGTIILPNSISNIGSEFKNRSKITLITIPQSVEWIGYWAFEGCSSLVSFEIDASNPNYSTKDGILYDKNKTYLIRVPERISGEIILPSSITKIESYAFSDCNNLTSVTIPNSVTDIGFGIFSGCGELVSITIPFVGATLNGSTNTHFGYIFGDAPNVGGGYLALKTVIITGGTSISSNAFNSRFFLTTISIPNSVTNIGYQAFYNCGALTSIIIPNSVTVIGAMAFKFCSELTSITLPTGLTIIEEGTFDACSKLSSIIIPNGITTIERDAFSRCSKLTELHIPDNVTNIKEGGFQASGLTSIVLPSKLTSISNKMFASCSELKSITIPSSITKIESWAFENCSNLTSVSIPGSVTSIGTKAFLECNKLTTITIPFIGERLNGTWNTHFGYIFGAQSKDENQQYVPASLKTVIITSGITSIGHSVFNGCSNITSIIIPNSVTIIDVSAFMGCSGLISVVIPENVTSIDGFAFWGCSELTSITIPESVTYIGSYAFYNCDKLNSVTFAMTVGWYITNNLSATSGTDITVTDIGANSTFLKSTYVSYYWKRNT